MKKIVFLASFFLLIILVLSSCKKQNAPNSGGSWVFKSQTYTAPFCSYITGALTASTETNTPTGSIAFFFYDSFSNAHLQQYHRFGFRDTVISTYPPRLSSYKVTNVFPPDSGYVFIELTDTAVSNYYVVTGSTTPSVTVTRSPIGSDTSLFTVTLPSVMMFNVNSSNIGFPSHSDSSLVFGTIIQTQ